MDVIEVVFSKREVRKIFTTVILANMVSYAMILEVKKRMKKDEKS